MLAGKVTEASMQKMPVTTLNALPLLITGQSVAELETERDWLMVRLPSLVVGAMVLVAVVIWSHNLFGWKGAMVSFCAAMFCPNLAAHSTLATNDISCTLGILIALWGLAQFVKKGSYTSLFVAAFFTGIAQLTKNTAIILIPIGSCVILTNAVYSALAEFKTHIAKHASKAFLKIVFFAVVILLCINIGYRFQGTMVPLDTYVNLYEKYMHQETSIRQSVIPLTYRFASLPVPLPYVFVDTILTGLKFNVTGEGHGPIYLFGRLSRMGFWYYFPMIFLLKVPIPLIVLSACACIGVVKNRHGTGVYLVCCAAMIFLFFTFGCSAQVGFRYLLPMMPLLYVVMGIIPSMCDRYGRPAKGLLAIALAWLAISTTSYYPHLLSYMNEAVLDRTTLYRYCADSNLDWDQNGWYLRKYLERHPFAKVEPEYPSRGEVIISANYLVGISAPPDKYRWIRENYQPVDTIGYSWLVFSIP